MVGGKLWMGKSDVRSLPDSRQSLICGMLIKQIPQSQDVGQSSSLYSLMLLVTTCYVPAPSPFQLLQRKHQKLGKASRKPLAAFFRRNMQMIDMAKIPAST